jgi:hypothetical protein
MGARYIILSVGYIFMSRICLLERTIDLLNNRPKPLTLEQIEADNPDLPRRWLSSFASGKITDPSVRRVQTLYEYLTNAPLISE